MSEHPSEGRRPMSIRRRVWKALLWGSVLFLTILVGGTIAAYHYVTDSDTLSELVRREAPRYLPGCRVDVIKVRVRPIAGEITLIQPSVRERGEAPSIPVAQALRVQVRYDPWAMAKGRFKPREVVLTKPKLRLRRRADGSWNLQGLLADPWPGPKSGAIPPITVQEGAVELIEDDAKPGLTILRDVAIAIPASGGPGPVAFELTAKGDFFDRIHVEGAIDPGTGRVEIKAGELVRLNLSESLRERIPARAREALRLAGLAGGEVDAGLKGLSFDPGATPRLRYAATARLRRGLWQSEKLPFPISDVSVDAEAHDGELTVSRALGTDGATAFLLRGRAAIGDPARAPFEGRLEATNLELDDRLRRVTPEPHRELWALYFPQVGGRSPSSAGRINAVVTASRPAPGAEVVAEVAIKALDVSVKYRHFPYPIDHVQGDLHATRKKLRLDLRTLVGNGPLRVKGEVADPGPEAVADLDFAVESLPVDDALLLALPPDVRKVVDDFKPSGSVKGRARLHRDPPLKPGDDPRGRVKFDAWVDLIPGSGSVTWKELKYPVRNLTGRLEIHPDLWIIQRMRGNNGQAVISADGRVEQVRRNRFKVDLKLKAENLPFDHQLRDALPTPWKVTWATLNPTGASNIEAAVDVDPDRLPRPEHDRIEIRPLEQTGVRLVIRREPRPGVDPGGPVELQMADVSGRFVYDTANLAAGLPPTEMSDVGFHFQGSPVRFRFGRVDVKDSGAFALGVSRLEVSNLRLDEQLRRKMPPEMARLARRLDDRTLPLIRADLGLGWSGRAGDSPWCRWEDALVILRDNKVEVGDGFDLEHIQGQLSPVRGLFDGRTLEVHGKLDLPSISVLGQQVTRLKADLDVKDGQASLDRIEGSVLHGSLQGHLKASLDVTPRFSVGLSVCQADLHEYAKTLKGHQTVKGLVNGWFNLSGIGADPHTITGLGEARMVQGDLGHLPVALRFINALKLARDTRTAFDEANVAFRVINGETSVDKIQFHGNAFSLDGRGSLDVRGDLDLKLRILAGRDSWHIPVFSDLTRELSGQILVVRVHGPLASPSFRPEVIPLTGEIFRARKDAHPDRKLDAPWRTGLEPRLRAGLASRWRGQAD